MSERGDVTDRASVREEEMRADALAVMARRQAQQAGRVSAHVCRLCDAPIPEARRQAVPGVQTCVDCQVDIENALHARGL